MVCSVPECGRKVSAKGMCRKHYTADWREKRGETYRTQQRAYNKNYFKEKMADLSPAQRKKIKKVHASYQRDWRSRHKDRLRNSEKYGQRYLRNYGLTKKAYEDLLKSQGGGCSICGTPPSTKRLAVDHDHKTGKVRGILCEPCNHGLGKFRDDPSLCHSAAAYLEEHATS